MSSSYNSPSHSALSSHNTSSSSAVCRFCFSSESTVPYIGGGRPEPLGQSYCHCKGTTGLYHRACMEHWLMLSRKTSCDICKKRFNVVKEKRAFCEYIGEALLGKSHNTESNLLPNILCILLFTPLTIFFTYLLVQSALKAVYKLQEIDTVKFTFDEHFENPLIQLIVYSVTAFCLAFVYLCWMIATVWYQFTEFREWQWKHVRIRIISRSTSGRMHTSRLVDSAPRSILSVSRDRLTEEVELEEV